MTVARGTEPLVDVRGLHKTFPNGTAALRGIDLRIDHPGIFGVVGPDGAGKTTLLRALVGILSFEAEQVRVLGHALPGGALALKSDVGYVPQVYGLYGDMSISENLQFFATLRGIPKAEFNARKTELLEATALAPFEDRPAGKLSGGMKQKLAITCALLHRPRLLILDEPNNGVDVAARQEVWQLLSQSPDTLVIISTNYADEAALCDELIYLMHGRLLTRGTPSSILGEHGAQLNEYRVYGHNLTELAEALSSERWILSSSHRGSTIEIRTSELPREEVYRRIRSHPAGGARVSLIEQRRPDMSTTLHALTREAMRDG